MTISPETLALWKQPHWAKFYAFVHKPEVVFKARVFGTLGDYPATYIPYDTVTVGAYTDLKAGMTLLIGSADGLDDYGRIRIRESSNGTIATTSLINIQRASRGILDGEINIINDAYITVLDFYQVWSVPSYIPDGSERVLKDTDYEFQATNHHRPVANAGVDTLCVLEDDGDTIELPFGLTPSLVTNPDADPDLDYSWVMPDGQTSTSATPSFTLEAPTVGYAELTVTDSEGGTRTARCFIAVVSKSHPDLISKFLISNHTQRADGQELIIEVDSPLPYSEYPDGAEILVAAYARYGNQQINLAGLEGREQMIFAGWLQNESFSGGGGDRGFLSRTSFTCIDTAGRAKVLPSFPLILERETTPNADSWTQLKGLNIDRYVHFLGDWHSTIFDRTDFTWSGTGDTYGVQVLGSDGESLYQQMDIRTQAIAHKLSSDRYGRLRMVVDPQLQEAADRTTNYVVEVTPEIWSSYSYQYIRVPSVHWNWGEALIASTADADSGTDINVVFCQAPGKAPGIGLSSQTSGQQVVISQTELNRREGHRYSSRMNPVMKMLSLKLGRYGDIGIDPANMEWIQFSNSQATAGQRGRLFSQARFMPVEIQYQYNHEAGFRVPTISCERDITGFAATTYDPPEDPGFEIPDIPIYPIPEAPLPFPIPGWDPDNQIAPAKIWALGYEGAVIVRSIGVDPVTGAVAWDEVASVASTITGVGLWACSDPHNYFRKFILTSTGLWRIEDLWESTPTATLVANNATMFGDAGRIGHYVMMTHNDRKGWIAVLSGQNAFAYSFDYGATWNVASIDGAALTYGTSTTDVLTTFIAMACPFNSSSNGRIFTVRGGATAQIYQSNDWGVSWANIDTLATNGLGGSYCRIFVPYLRQDGTPNLNDSDQEVFLSSWQATGNRSDIYFSDTAATSWTNMKSTNGSGDRLYASSPPMHPMNFFTHDSTRGLILGRNVTDSFISLTDDGFTTVTPINMPFFDATPRIFNINGFAAHKDWSIIWSSGSNPSGAPVYGSGNGGIVYTANGWASAIAITPSEFTDGRTMYVEGDLSTLIPSRG